MLLDLVHRHVMNGRPLILHMGKREIEIGRLVGLHNRQGVGIGRLVGLRRQWYGRPLSLRPHLDVARRPEPMYIAEDRPLATLSLPARVVKDHDHIKIA